jgi:hypothetical protein
MSIKWVFQYWYVFVGSILVIVAFVLYWFLIRHQIDSVPKYEREPFFVYAKEGKTGLETAYSEEIERLNDPYKKQLISFLEQVIEQLKPKVKK